MAGGGRMSRAKGNRAELKVAKMIAEAIGLPEDQVRRTPNSGALVERADLRLSDEALKRFGWFVEVKAREGWDLHRAFAGGVERWEPIVWFRDAEDKRARQKRTGFPGAEYPVLLVLMKNRRAPLAMTLTGVLGIGNVGMVVDGYTVMPFEDVLALCRTGRGEV